MKKIISQEFGGERPLYASHDLSLEDVTIHAGESSLKECTNIEMLRCRFEGKYPLWRTDGFRLKDCHFTEGGRAALWYSRRMVMEDTLVEAPKMFRDSEYLRLKNVRLTQAGETFWHCKDVEAEHLETLGADYIFMHCANVRLSDFHLEGNYSFQYCRDVEIRDAVLNTKDAFWNTENVTVIDSEINGEFLGWHSRNLRLVNCRITGSQPLCYCENLVLENCEMGADADLAFEYSTVRATVRGNIVSVKNPSGGSISADSIGEIIMDENVRFPNDCVITTK